MTTPKRAFLLFGGLYLLSFAILVGWIVLLLTGLVRTDGLTLAVTVGSILSLEVFRRLARRAER